MKPLLFAAAAALLLLPACETKKSKKNVPPPTVLPPQPGSSSANLNSGNDFLRANALKPGVVTTPSGLQYQVLASGASGGRSPTKSDSVKVNYRGTLIDGTEFDSSIGRGVPAVFGVGQVIPGWTEALQLMKPGDKWMVYIPSRLAYGERGMGTDIPPNSTLIFMVELLEVVGAG